MNKFKKDGKVAVLYSPGFGAGWYTWNGKEQMIFDPDIVEAVLKDEDPTSIAEEKYPDEYCGGAYKLQVAWVDEGAKFKIDEYDGSESIVLKEDKEIWIMA